MNALDEATTIATQFNAKHTDVQLKIVRVTTPLTEDEVRAALIRLPGGWYLAAEVFRFMRGRSANHGETVRAGRLLKSMNFDSKRLGPRTAYLLDNSASAGAD